MPSIEKVISDIELRIYGGKPSDDAEIPRSQIQMWLDTVNSAAVSNWIVSENGGEVPSWATRQDFCVGLKADKPNCVGGCESYYYIEIPKVNEENVSVLNLKDEKAIMGLYRGKEEIFNFGTVARSRIVSGMRFANKMPFFNRVGDRIYVYNGIYPLFCKFTLVYASVDTFSLEETDDFPTVDKLLPTILEEVEKIGRRELEGVNDLLSDGIDE